jgi:hypothetical protein
MGRRPIATKVSFREKIKEIIEQNRQEIDKKAKELTFNEFCKWFHANKMQLENHPAFRQELKRNNVTCKIDPTDKRRWNKGLFDRAPAIKKICKVKLF